MKRFFTYFVSKEVLIPLFMVFAVLMVILAIFSAKLKGFKEIRKKFLYYGLLIIFITGVYFLILYNLKQTAVFFRFVALQIYFVIIGSVHVYLYRTVFKSLKSEKILTEIVFAFLTSLMIAISLLLIITHYNDKEYLIIFFTSLLAFIFPTIIYRLYLSSISIPMALFDKWYYPVTKRYDPPGINEFKNTIVLDLYFYKGDVEMDLTKFKVKAPKAMEFGRLFYFFVTEYNEKHLGSQISLLEADNTPYGWYFFVKPKWYSKAKRIDTNLSIENNNLQDKMNIICQRVETKNKTES